jgi:signal peptidase I
MVDRPRRWPLAGFLSFIAPGLGQIYNGEWAKALVLLAVYIPFGIFLGILLFTPWFPLALPLALLFVLAFWVYATVDAILVSRRLGQAYELQWFNRVVVYVGLVFIAAVARETVTVFLRATVVQAFRIPSESMLPTLEVGDFVFADKRPIGKQVTRGDVIAFVDPEDPRRQYIKRVVAVGGDRVELRDKALVLNGHVQAETYVVHIAPSTHPGEFDPRDNFGPYPVPQGTLFVLGDNRDNSNDSRFWGPLKQSLVIGKILRIYWSWDPEAHAARWNRIGMPVR